MFLCTAWELRIHTYTVVSLMVSEKCKILTIIILVSCRDFISAFLSWSDSNSVYKRNCKIRRKFKNWRERFLYQEVNIICKYLITQNWMRIINNNLPFPLWICLFINLSLYVRYVIRLNVSVWHSARLFLINSNTVGSTLTKFVPLIDNISWTNLVSITCQYLKRIWRYKQ